MTKKRRHAKPARAPDRHRLSELEQSLRAHYREHPVLAELASAAIDRVSRSIDSLSKAQLDAEDMDTFLQLTSEALELLSWFVPLRRPALEPEREAAIEAWASELKKTSVPTPKVLEILKVVDDVWRKRPQGRPVTRRSLAVTALEMKLANPRLSWTGLSNRICPCEKSEHDWDCRERIRQQVLALQTVLKKYRISPKARRVSRPYPVRRKSL